MFAVPGGLIGVGTKVGATWLSPTVFDVMIDIEDWFDFCSLWLCFTSSTVQVDPTLCRADRMVGQVFRI